MLCLFFGVSIIIFFKNSYGNFNYFIYKKFYIIYVKIDVDIKNIKKYLKWYICLFRIYFLLFV